MARTLPSTTFAAAIALTDNIVSLAAVTAQNVTLAAGQLLFSGREAMLVISADLVAKTAKVSRGYDGTAPSTHPSGATVWFAPPGDYAGSEKRGTGDPANETVLPRVIPRKGIIQNLRSNDGGTTYAWYTVQDRPFYSESDFATVTQITTITTGVTVNALAGEITTVSQTVAAGAEADIVVTNSRVAAGDMVVACIKTHTSAGSFIVGVITTANGSFTLRLTNLHAANAGNDVLVISFRVLKQAAN